MDKGIKRGSQEWELSGWNDLGVPYFVKVKGGKTQRTEYTLRGFGVGAIEQFGIKATKLFTNPFTGKTSKRWESSWSLRKKRYEEE